jgi:hypothetical protein
MWQPFTSHRQNWAGSLLPRKRAPDTIHITPTDRSMGSYPVYLRSQPWSSGGKAKHLYVQYLLMGINPSVLNRHRRRLPHRNLGIATTLSPPFLFECSTGPPKWPRPVSILSNNYQLNWRGNNLKSCEWELPFDF